MKEKFQAIWQLVLGLLLYPLAFAALIWIAWTGRSVWLGVAVIAVVLILDRSWWYWLRPLFSRTKKRPRRRPPGR